MSSEEFDDSSSQNNYQEESSSESESATNGMSLKIKLNYELRIPIDNMNENIKYLRDTIPKILEEKFKEIKGTEILTQGYKFIYEHYD